MPVNPGGLFSSAVAGASIAAGSVLSLMPSRFAVLPAAMLWHKWRLPVLAMTAATPIAGCAIGNVGTLAAEITHADVAWVADVYAIGAHLRTRSDDAGLTLGYGRHSYVFPASDGKVPRPGWYYFIIPLPVRDAVAVDARDVGIAAYAGAREAGATIGLRSATTMTVIPNDSNVTLRLTYSPGDPRATVLHYCDGVLPC